MRAIPQIAVIFVAAHEGLRTRAYEDGAGAWTIGYGHTEGVTPGRRCTREQALAWLSADMAAAQTKLYGVLKPAVVDALTEHQWAALLSFVFNLGAGKGWTIWKRLNARQFDQVPGEMIKFVNAGGRKVRGLVNRRADEVKLWSTDEPGSAGEAPPSAVTREMPTPPMPADPVPLSRSATLLLSGAGAVASAAPMVDQARRTVEPFAVHSLIVQRVLGILAVAGAALALLGLVLMWLKAREART